jgi:hypothetical protein
MVLNVICLLSCMHNSAHIVLALFVSSQCGLTKNTGTLREAAGDYKSLEQSTQTLN